MYVKVRFHVCWPLTCDSHTQPTQTHLSDLFAGEYSGVVLSHHLLFYNTTLLKIKLQNEHKQPGSYSAVRQKKKWYKHWICFVCATIFSSSCCAMRLAYILNRSTRTWCHTPICCDVRKKIVGWIQMWPHHRCFLLTTSESAWEE